MVVVPRAHVDTSISEHTHNNVNYDTVYREIFVLKKFGVLNFRVKKFSWSWLDHEIFQHL